MKKRAGKYNFLLLHDDGEAKSFRISRRAICILIAIVVLLPIVGGCGVWLGWQVWHERQEWEQEERLLQQEINNLRVQLERLHHIERMISVYESGQLPGGGGDGRATAESGSDAASIAAAIAAASGASGATMPQSAEGGNGGGQSASATPPGDAAQGQPGDKPDPDKAVVNTGQMRMDAVSVILSRDRRLRVSIDLYNDVGRLIAGTLQFYLLTVDGTRTPLPYDEAAFRISRFKKVAAILTIPGSVGDLTNAALAVEAVSSEKTLLLRQFYPIAE
jgi:hypothetical protein